MSSMDPQPTDDRKSRMEYLLWVIGGCEVAIRNNDKSGGAFVSGYSKEFRKMQQKYLKKLERLMNGLPEDES